MNEDLLIRIKNRLKLEYYLMNDEWLRDCIEFYINQHEHPTTEEILQFVKVQWQLCDLREINNENGSLPQNLSQQKLCTLSGNYILQVEQMYDISTSKYKQLEQIRNTHISEVELTETEKLEKWEPPKKRMMQLRLTDGLQDVIGIEYKPMPQLNDTLLPGYKIMIMGPVTCRKGVLLLEEKKLKGIGGEVDSLLIPNALENILARALKLQENPDPYNDNQTRINKDKMPEPQISAEPQMLVEPEVQDTYFEDDFDINLEEFCEIEAPHSKTHKVDKNVNQMGIQTKNITNHSTKTKSEQFQTHESPKIMDDDDCFLAMIDENQLVEPQTERNISAPYRVLPKEEDDDIIIINDDDKVMGVNYGDETKTMKRETDILHVSYMSSTSKSNTTIITPKAERTRQPLFTGAKRPIPMSPSERVVSKKGKIDRKITEFAKIPNCPAEPKICEFICDIKAELITETTFKTIRGRVEVLGKLTKKDSVWILDAKIEDGTGTMEVSFSNKVLEDILGFSVKEFSIKKKLKKNPEIDRELRMSFRTAEQKIKTMDALLELQINANAKPIIIKITDLTEEQKKLIDTQLNKLLQKSNI